MKRPSGLIEFDRQHQVPPQRIHALHVSGYSLLRATGIYTGNCSLFGLKNGQMADDLRGYQRKRICSWECALADYGFTNWTLFPEAP